MFSPFHLNVLLVMYCRLRRLTLADTADSCGGTKCLLIITQLSFQLR
jgi:hypothetical protein